MDNTFMIEADYPTGTKVLVYDGEDADGNIQTYPRTLRRTTHLMPPNYYLGRRIQAIDLSQIHDNAERDRIENERRLAWQDRARRRPYDNNNPDPNAPPPVNMNDDVPMGRVFVPQGGRKSRRGRKSKKSRKRRSRKTNRRRRR
jgi:hypothetical protein